MTDYLSSCLGFRKLKLHDGMLWLRIKHQDALVVDDDDGLKSQKIRTEKPFALNIQ